MNDGNIAFYLKNRMYEIGNAIEQKQAYIKGAERNIDDWLKEIKNLKVHYSALLQSSLAYNKEEDDTDTTDLGEQRALDREGYDDR